MSMWQEPCLGGEGKDQWLFLLCGQARTWGWNGEIGGDYAHV